MEERVAGEASGACLKSEETSNSKDARQYHQRKGLRRITSTSSRCGLA